MLTRKPIFPHVIEMNHQAGQRLGCNVYLLYDGNDWILIDVGFEDTVDVHLAEPVPNHGVFHSTDAVVRSVSAPIAWPRSRSARSA